ncbi:MAG TPA: hypothetical protein VMW27_02515, partial [Thermoanaerobaculia bacterium]|nr:hypothetical protein [Thermoanaerobaculia bacterium]
MIDQMMTQFPARLGAPDIDVRRLRLDLRASLGRLREANRRRCGWEREDGWELAEERVADSLAELDPRLVPLPPAGRSPAFGVSEVKALEKDLAAAPLAEPHPGVIGSLAAFQLSRQEGAVVRRLTDFRAQVVAE